MKKYLSAFFGLALITISFAVMAQLKNFIPTAELERKPNAIFYAEDVRRADQCNYDFYLEVQRNHMSLTPFVGQEDTLRFRGKNYEFKYSVRDITEEEREELLDRGYTEEYLENKIICIIR